MNATTEKVFTILLVEDNGGDVEMFLRTVEEELPRQEGERVELVINATGEGGLKRLQERPIDLVITDVRLPGMSGIDFLKHVQEFDRLIPVIVISWVDTVETAVEAVRHGAFDYVVKPFEKFNLAARIHRAMRMADIFSTVRQKPQPRETVPFRDILGVSPGICSVKRAIQSVAVVPTTTLIIGETGTGKELIAKAIHERSAERCGPFQVVDCTGFSEGTVESELFGHVRGAFTGAVSDRKGLIEAGSQGTVFLDEIGELPLGLQAKLLRVLEEGEVRAVGSSQQRKVSARFIAATNKNLADKVKDGSFRKDLFFRLNVMVIHVPPLRERSEDIPFLARHFIQQFAQEFGKYIEGMHPSAVTELVAYSWPGNVRELRNVMERAVMLAEGSELSQAEIARILQSSNGEGEWEVFEDYLHLPYAKAKEKVLEAFNRRYLSFKLSNHDGNVKQAANEAGVPRSYFHEIMRRYLRDIE
jgi:DNA-binding NtrC family response regulator